MSKDVLWHDGRESNKVVEPPDRCYLGGVTYISVDLVLQIIRNHTVSGYGNMGEVVNIHIYDTQGMIAEIEALKGGKK